MKETTKPSKEYFLILASLIIGLLFLLLDNIGAINFLQQGISYVMTPIVFQGDSVGKGGREYLETFTKLKQFREEFNEMRIDIYEKDVENAFYIILKEENESLKKQISLGKENQKYVMSKVLGDKQYDVMNINEGNSAGVQVGDVVVWGNMFVGTVINANEETSLVRLPTSRNASFEVVVVRGGVEEARLPENLKILSKGVVTGSPEGIKVENMSMNANLQNGDVVIVNDTKVGQYLVLGYLVGLSDNPAATSRSGFVSPIVEYDDLLTVFVVGGV